MRPSVLVIHERYRQAGGEDAVVDAEVALLRSHGHDVDQLIVDNAQISERAGPAARARLAAGTVWSFSGAAAVRHRIETTRPDVVHVHNFLPLLSPSIHVAARRAGPAVVQTLHNFRLVCPAGTLFRDGAPCEDCVGRRVAGPAVVHGCYRGSRGQTAVVAAMLATHAIRGTWRHDVDAFIAVSATVRDRVIKGGLPAARVVVKGNFVADTDRAGRVGGAAIDQPRDDSVLFVGRLAVEKGVDLLVDTWLAEPGLPPLVIAGDGPLALRVAAAAEASPRIQFVGRLSPADVRTWMDRAAALIFPSRWYEGQPVAILEAFAAGLPVLGSRLGSIGELVTDGVEGRLFNPDSPSDVATVVREAMADRARLAAMGRAARATYERSHTPDANYAQLIDVYRQAIANKEGSSRPADRTAGPTRTDAEPR